MLNDVWLKMAEFLGRLNGESVSRESYVRRKFGNSVYGIVPSLRRYL